MRKTLLVSVHNAERKFWNGICYDFLTAIEAIEHAVTVAPQTRRYSKRDLGLLWRENQGAIGATLRDYRWARQRALFEASPVEEDFDLCLFVLFFPRDVHQIERVKGWRERSRFAAVYLIEAWSGDLEAHRDSLKILDRFDHVFVLNSDCIPNLARYTKTPVTFLPTATDCLRAAPSPAAGLMPERRIDVLALGRQLPDVHARLLEIAARRGIFYHYDVWSSMLARDWELVRRMNAELTTRARYSLVWDPTFRPLPGKAKQIATDRALSTRFFEASAGGAIMLGRGTPSAAFTESFDWDDALVPIEPDGSDVETIIDALDADFARRAAIRRSNVTNALRRHDWVYRWEKILDTFGLEPTALHLARREMLASHAERVSAATWPDDQPTRTLPQLVATSGS